MQNTLFARSALYLRDVDGRTTEICPFRDDATTNHNHFLRMANGMRDRVLVKYVIFEKFRSDPEKDGSEVALAVDTSIHRDPVFGRLFSTFWRFSVKKRFALTRSIFGIL